MKPRVKPQKDWRFRLIFCDSEGRVVFDDFNYPELAEGVLKHLLIDYEKLKIKEKVAG
jgi:hypothetical protein